MVPKKSKTQNSKKKPSLKNQSRSILRLLKRKNVPENVKSQKLKELEEISEKKHIQNQQIHEKKISKKYHKIRFFEKKKIKKKIKRVKNIINDAKNNNMDDEYPNILEELQKLKNDLNYIENFPKGMKYISIFGTYSDPLSKKCADEQKKNILQLINQQNAANSIHSIEQTKSLDDNKLHDEFLLSESEDDINIPEEYNENQIHDNDNNQYLSRKQIKRMKFSRN